MAVHNAGTVDERVVKAAEAAARAGYDVHVVGSRPKGFSELETQNGVTYHRVVLRWKLRYLLLGWFPRLIGFFRPPRPVRPARGRGFIRRFLARLAQMMGAAAFATFGRLGVDGPLVRLARAVVRPVRWLLRRLRRLPRRILQALRRRLGRIAGRESLFNVHIRGRYLGSYFHKLVELRGQIYHAHELWMLEACAMAAGRKGAKLIYDSHELEAHRQASWSGRVRRGWVEHEQRLMPRVDGVITVSDGIAGELKRAYGLADVTVVRNVPTGTFDSPPAGLRQSLGLADSTPLIVYVGAVTHYRGLEMALAALELLPEFVLATVGPVNERTVEELLAEVDRRGLGRRFLMHPKVPPTQVVEFIASADVSILLTPNTCLNHYYCMPNKLFQSAFAGLPIVSGDLADIRAFVNRWGIGEMCNQADPADVARAIRAAYQRRDSYYTPDKIQSLRRECCYEAESTGLLALYRRVLGTEAPVEPQAAMAKQGTR